MRLPWHTWLKQIDGLVNGSGDLYVSKLTSPQEVAMYDEFKRISIGRLARNPDIVWYCSADR